MKHDYKQLLKPDIINSVEGLSLIARVIVDGYLSGLHKSRRVGPGLEFSQYRGYEPGDDLRLLDWKMLARSDRYYVKQSEIETHITVKFILDNSKSMMHTDGGLSKMEYVKILVAALAHLSNRQGDAIGLFALNDTGLISLHPTAHKQQYQRLLHELVEIKSDGIWPQKATSLEKLHNRSGKELIFFITDLYENGSELTDFIRSLKTVRNEVIVLHLMSTNELNFAYEGQVLFEDLETGKKIKVNSKEAKEEYLKGLRSMLSETKQRLLSQGISYQMFNTEEPLGEALQAFLKTRDNLM